MNIDDIEQLLDRDTYRRIKKMDRATLEGLIQDIFERGRKKGLAEAGVMVDESMADDRGGTLDLRAVEAEIRGIKGIGEKRAEEIMLIFELRFMICASAVFSGMIMHNQQYQDGSLFIRWAVNTI